MSVLAALIAFSAAAAVLTVTPGLDTALVLRTAAVDGPRRAALASLGVILGCLTWAAAAAIGLAALLAASQAAFTALKWAGAAYLTWLGLNLILKSRNRLDLDRPAAAAGSSFRRGLFSNLLNPKVGVFYISFLPQFVPAGVAPAPFIVLLAAIHAVITLVWFALLIAATRPLAGALRRAAVVRWLDRVTGGVFLAFGLRLALDRR